MPPMLDESSKESLHSVPIESEPNRSFLIMHAKPLTADTPRLQPRAALMGGLRQLVLRRSTNPGEARA